MNLLEIAQKDGRSYKKASNIHGGEYHGPCPSCGGSDRFHVWPEQGEHGTFWCRACGLGGDAIEYLIKFESMTFPEACKQVGKDLPEQQEYQSPHFKKPAAGTFTPRETIAPVDAWKQHAWKLIDWAHQQLLNSAEQMAYLAGRGITRDAVIKFRLGWNPGEKGKDLYRAREAWGLNTIEKENGGKKKLWIPIGIVIPYIVDGDVRRIRIRIPNERRMEQFKRPYQLIDGSSMESFITRTDTSAWFIIEAELDAIMLDAQAGDLCGFMAMGNSTARPTAAAFDHLSASLYIGNALDYDARTTEEGKYENAGGVGWLWWKKQFIQAERHPVPVGKDPGDAFKAGVDIREWVKIGLPPILTLPKSVPTPVLSNPEPQKTVIQAPQQAPEIHTIISKDGRLINITDNQAAYRQLAAAGKIVFTSREIFMIKNAGLTADKTGHYLDLKQTYPGCSIENIESLQEIP